jgi:hypothetical protein
MLNALASGVAGSLAVNAVHESMRRVVPHAPRMDVIGTRAIRRPMVAAGYKPPHWNKLHNMALAGDLVANSIYYALAAAGPRETARMRGLLLGLAAGVGGVVLPPLMGLGNPPHRKAPYTQLMTIAWYTLGGIVAGEIAHHMTPPKRSRLARLLGR